MTKKPTKKIKVWAVIQKNGLLQTFDDIRAVKKECQNIAALYKKAKVIPVTITYDK